MDAKTTYEFMARGGFDIFTKESLAAAKMLAEQEAKEAWPAERILAHVKSAGTEVETFLNGLLLDDPQVWVTWIDGVLTCAAGDAGAREVPLSVEEDAMFAALHRELRA